MCQWCTRLNVIACLSESYPLIRLPALIITQYWFIISTQTMVVNSTHVNFHISIRDRYWNHCRVHENVLGLCTWCLLMLYLGISQLSSTTKCLLMRLRSRTGARAQDIPWKSICPCWGQLSCTIADVSVFLLLYRRWPRLWCWPSIWCWLHPSHMLP